MVGKRSIPDSPYDGHMLVETLEQTGIFTGIEAMPRMAIVDRGCQDIQINRVRILRPIQAVPGCPACVVQAATAIFAVNCRLKSELLRVDYLYLWEFAQRPGAGDTLLNVQPGLDFLKRWFFRFAAAAAFDGQHADGHGHRYALGLSP